MKVQDLVCPNCGSRGNVVLDYERGEYVCANCGLVLDRVYYTYSPSEVEARRVLEERLKGGDYTEIERREAGIREKFKRFIVKSERVRILRAFMAKKSYEQRKKREEKVDDIEFILEYESGMRVDLSLRIVIKYIHLIGFEVDPTASATENWKRYVKSTPRSVRLRFTEFREYLQFVEKYMYLKMGEKYRPSKSRYGRRGRGKLSLSIHSDLLALLRNRPTPLSVEHGILMDFLDHCRKCLGRRIGIEELKKMSRRDLIKLLYGFPYPIHILNWLEVSQNSW